MLEILTSIIRRNEPVEDIAVATYFEKSLKERHLMRAREKFHSMEEVYGPDFLAPPKIITTQSS